MPPSVNCAYAGKTRRYKSKPYNAWLKTCESYKNKRFKVSGTEKLVASYKFYSKFINKDQSIKTKDLSNYFKLMEDYFKHLIIGFDDRQIFTYKNVEKHHSDKEIVKIKIWENYG